MSYTQTEIPAVRKEWAHWLRTFSIGDIKPIDLKDRRRIATSISNNFHKCTPYRFEIRKVDEFTGEVERLQDVEVIF